jgi:hypothetical protein
LAGICLIRLLEVRPRGLPQWIGFASENAAHRIAVEWDDHGTVRRGVYVPRRDTSSWLNVLAGGRLFPGAHHLSRFVVEEADGRYRAQFEHQDGTRVSIDGRLADRCQAGSTFTSTADATSFFECGALGYSATSQPGAYDGLELRTWGWTIHPLEVDHVASSLFENRRLFPAGSIEFDSAFLMRHVAHEWHARGRMIHRSAASRRSASALGGGPRLAAFAGSFQSVASHTRAVLSRLPVSR